jgi:starch synthase
MPLRICFAASEIAPLAKTGGLADVTAALVKYLHAAGHDVRAFLPYYATLAHEGLSVQRLPGLQDLPLQLGRYAYRFSVLIAQLPGSSAQIYLIECPTCFERPSIYTSDADEHRRFLVLTHATFIACQHLVFAPQIMHFHDWHTAIGPLLLRSNFAWDRLFQGARSVLTIHNVGYQGIVGADALPEVLAGAPAALLDAGELAAGRIGLLRTGIALADLITTVSPTYAREIQGREYGMGLEGLLRSRAGALVGVLNGVDYDEWDPRHDRYLPQGYDAEHLAVKAGLKATLLQRLGLAGSTAAQPGATQAGATQAGAARVPLIGMVSRLVAQKGLELVFEALPRLLPAREFAVAALGSGESPYEQFFAALARSSPARVYFQRGYSDELAHWIEAASDIFLMPSQYEPCGLNQMYSLRYGSVPLVRRTGGLADSVQPYEAASDAGAAGDSGAAGGSGTGFVFEEYSAAALTARLGEALDVYADERRWDALVRRGMAQDFSWQRQVQRYVELYERLSGR